MCKLRVKNFGPITAGYDSDDGFMDFEKCTLFIGDQGAGKSTVAKLFSVFSWLEKAFFRGDYDAETFGIHDFEELCRNQLLDNSFAGETELEYAGDAFRFSYKKAAFLVEQMADFVKKYNRPKIMYIPSERNILSVVKNVEELSNLPPMLRLLRTRYMQASALLEGKGEFSLPLAGYRAFVNKMSGETFVLSEPTENVVPLICASSGLQSIVPSSLVTIFLAGQSKKSVLERLKEIKETDLKSLKNSIDDETVVSELERYLTSGITKSVSASSLKVIEPASRKYTNSCFINIVEEPEQNLFPTSQKNNIEFLIAAANLNPNNKLVITTHSPYILESINNSIYAAMLQKKGLKAETLVKKEKQISYDDVAAYVIKNGEIHSIKSDDINQIDPKEIDGCSEEINTVYSKLSDMEF